MHGLTRQNEAYKHLVDCSDAIIIINEGIIMWIVWIVGEIGSLAAQPKASKANIKTIFTFIYLSWLRATPPRTMEK